MKKGHTIFIVLVLTEDCIDLVYSQLFLFPE